MRQAGFFIARPAYFEPRTLVEGLGAGLRVQHHLVVATVGRGAHQRMQHLRTQARAAQSLVHGHAADARHPRRQCHQPCQALSQYSAALSTTTSAIIVQPQLASMLCNKVISKNKGLAKIVKMP